MRIKAPTPSLIPAMVFLAACLCSASSRALGAGERLPWHLQEWELRQIVELTGPATVGAGNTGFVLFEAAPPLIADDGRDVRVTDTKGRPVKFHWVTEQGKKEADPFGEHRRPWLHIEVTDPSERTYLVYFGNAKARPAAGDWDKKVSGLVLETRVCPANRCPANWLQMSRLVKRSKKVFGKGRRRQINDPGNPFGPSNRYLSIYKGLIQCPTDGIYGFATDSDDASFLLIDGRLVVQWPGGHNPSGKFDHHGTISLKAGIHRIEYYHVQVGGGALAKAGWRPPGAREFQTIPEAAFVRELRTRTVAVERRDTLLSAFFTARIVDSLQLGSTGPVFATVAFTDCSRSALSKVTAWEWDFGDGTISREQNPRYVFSGRRPCKVSLRCMDALGFESSWVKPIVLPVQATSRADIAMELSVDKPLLLPDEPLRVRLKCRNSGAVPLPMTLVTESQSAPGGVLHTDRESLLLQPGVWAVRDYTTAREGKNEPATGDVVFRLEYLGVAVLVRTVSVCAASDPDLALHVEQDHLADARGAHVVLRLSGQVGRRQDRALQAKLERGGPVHLVAVDGSLAGSAANNYLHRTAAQLAGRFPRSHFRISLLNPKGAGNGSDAMLRGLLELPDKIKRMQPDMVLVAGSLRDILRFTPVERFERALHALVDRIQGATEAEIVLVAPPPTIANPKLAQAYAMAVKRIGITRGVPVADAYSAFMKAGASVSGGRKGWRRFYRDPESEVPLYYVSPAAQGQKLIAEAVCDVLVGD